jgi:hypothetical protein
MNQARTRDAARLEIRVADNKSVRAIQSCLTGGRRIARDGGAAARGEHGHGDHSNRDRSRLSRCPRRDVHRMTSFMTHVTLRAMVLG